MGRGLQGLGLDEGVVFVAPGHDDYVVVLPDGDEVGDAGVVDEYGFFCLGEELLSAEVLPVLQNSAAEVYGGEGRHQCLGYMAAAEDVDHAGLDKLFAVVQILADPDLGRPGAKAGDDAGGDLGSDDAGFFGVHGQTSGLFRGDVGDKPGLLPVGVEGEDAVGQGKGLGIPCRDVLEIDVYVSAADHAQILHLVFAEPEVFHAGAFLVENGPGQLFASVLHGAAADGAGNAAVFGDEHPGSRTRGEPELATTVTRTAS